MKVISLQSGSNGNCFHVELDSLRLVFDAGISARVADQRLAAHGRDMADVDALFITHDHSDHIRGLTAFARRWNLPVYLTHGTWQAARRAGKLDSLERVTCFRAGETVSLPTPHGTVQVHSVPTPHDAAEGVAYVIEDEQGVRLGILTDLGHVFAGLREVLQSLDAVVIESNYDSEMLEQGRYPWRLKQRIRGRGGHLSNREAAELVASSVGARLRWACLCHLSQDNNCPELAVRTHQQAVGEDFPIHVAARTGPSGVFEV